jgi:tetratricopeptide (TPR) repeat protein
LALALLALPNGESNIDEAVKELERAIHINPDFFHSYGKLSEIYEKIGDAEKARTYREREQAILKKLFSP